MHLPACFASLILTFAPVFVQQRTWRRAELLLIGAILGPGKRTVTSLSRIVGLGRERRFTDYHRVLNRAAWDARAAARLLLGLLIAVFAPSGPVLLGIDDTIERRRGKRIAAKGIYRDPVRSSKGHLVKASGLRWLSLMLLAPIPWAGRVWALPFLTALAPSERHCRERGRRHKKLTDWARQMGLQARRWLPGREVVLLGDGSFAALELLAALARHGLVCITRLRLDAALYEPAPPPAAGGAREGAAPAAGAGDGRAPADQGRTPAEPRRRPGRRRHALGGGRRAGLVRGRRPRRRGLLRHRRTAPGLLAGRADPLGAAARPPAPLRAAGPALHRPGPRSAAGRALVRPALAGGGHLPRGARPPRRRDAAAVVGPRHRAHHALPARPVLDRDAARRASRPPRPVSGPHRCLVPQTAADLRRHPRRRPAAVLARAGFAPVSATGRGEKTPPHAPPRHRLRPLPSRLTAKVELRQSGRLVGGGFYREV